MLQPNEPPGQGITFLISNYSITIFKHYVKKRIQSNCLEVVINSSSFRVIIYKSYELYLQIQEYSFYLLPFPSFIFLFFWNKHNFLVSFPHTHTNNLLSNLGSLPQ